MNEIKRVIINLVKQIEDEEMLSFIYKIITRLMD